MLNQLHCLRIKPVYRQFIRTLLPCLCIFIAACDQTGHTSIRFGLNTAPITLDPRFITDAVSDRIGRLIYRRLTDFDEHYQVIPDLANWQSMSDTRYRFSLTESGRQFHHGKRLDADDVKATYESILQTQTRSPHRATLQHIQRIEVIDADTVDFYLSRADAFFPGRLNIGILPRDLLASQHAFNVEPVGTGSLRFVKWPSDNQLVLQRIDDQQMIEFITVKDPTVRVLKLARGEIDLLQGNLSQEDIRWLDKQQNINVDAEPGDVFTYIGFNLQDAATGNPDVRTAIAHAIDRQAIIAHVMRDRARPAGALLPPEHWAGNNTLNGIRYNPKKAKQMLAAAGYTIENPLQLTFKTSSDPLRIRLATIMQDQLKQVGIRMRIQSYDWGTFYGDIKNGRFQLYSLSWVGLKLPDIFRHVFHSDSTPPSGANRGRFDDPVTDSLIEQAEIATDPEQRRRIYFDLQHRLHDQLPYIPLWYEHNVVAYRQQLSGYRLASDGNYDAMMSVDKVER